MSERIEIIIEGHDGRLLWADFRKAIDEHTHVLNAVGRRLADMRTLPGNWRIERLSMNSPVEAVLEFEVNDPDFDPPLDWIPQVVRGMRDIEEGEVQPDGFSDEAIQHVSNLIVLRDRIDSFTLNAGREKARTTVVAASHAQVVHERNKAKRAKHYFVWGELRGELGQVTAHGSKHEFVVYDELDDHPIACHFTDDELQDVLAAVTRRVAVYGKITYNRNDRPSRVDIESWRVLRPDSELASMDTIRKALGDLPSGVSSEEYVRSLRDDD